MIQVPATQVPQLYMLEVLPHALVRVQFWRVSRQFLHLHELRPTALQESLDLLAAVDGRAVPHREESAAHHPPHVSQEGDAFGASERAAARQRVELPARRDPAHHREVSARQMRSQHRGDAARSVGADDAGQQVEARFVNEDGRAIFAPRFFFNSGHRSSRHPTTACSSRWAARSAGFCGVQRKAFRSRETWSLWYVTENSRRMTSATRAHVQTSPRKPYASAPCARNSGTRRNWSSVSRGVAPLWGRASKPSSPCSRTAAIHWLTATFVTPKTSAISCCVQPSRLSSRARQRRICFQSGVRDASVAMLALLPPASGLSYQCISL